MKVSKFISSVYIKNRTRITGIPYKEMSKEVWYEYNKQ